MENVFKLVNFLKRGEGSLILNPFLFTKIFNIFLYNTSTLFFMNFWNCIGLLELNKKLDTFSMFN